MPEIVDSRYELLDVVASGGMATVWRARDTRLGRVVALKRPHPAAPDDPGHRRVEEEARAAAAVNHPNLVTILDSGRDERGPYVVMEYLSGQTLAQTSTPLAAAEAVAIGSVLARALAAVHEAGIVHRDVKPANVILSENGPKLTDFGIAVRDDATHRITSAGQVVATPAYAAPEVLAGDEPTPAADVFALGALVHELLSGTPAFRGSDRSRTPPALGDVHLDSLLAAALSSDPSARPTSAAFAAALEGGSPTLVMGAAPPPPAPGGRVTGTNPGATTHVLDRAGVTPRRRRRWVAALASVAVLGLLTSAALTLGDDADGSTSAASTTTPPATSLPAPQTTASTPPATTATTTASSTTVPNPSGDPGEWLDELEMVVSSSRPSRMPPPERRDLADDIDRMRRAIDEGDDVDAAFEALAGEVADLRDERAREEAWPLMIGLADALDLDPEWRHARDGVDGDGKDGDGEDGDGDDD